MTERAPVSMDAARTTCIVAGVDRNRDMRELAASGAIRPRRRFSQLAARSAGLMALGVALVAPPTGAPATAVANSDAGSRAELRLPPVEPLRDGLILPIPASRPDIVPAGPAAVAPAAEPVPAATPAQADAEPALDPQEVLSFGKMKVRRWIVQAVLRAATETGVDPVYMMALADKESSLSPESSARTSSAEGLYQFVEQTWLDCVQRFGAARGLATEAQHIVTNVATGERSVADPAERERILALRRDPYVAGLMAGDMLRRDRERIEGEIGRDLTHHEIYMAHFLGPNSATRFLKLKSDSPEASAPKSFPAAARANKSIFFQRSGRKTKQLTVAEVYERIETMIGHRLDRYTDVTAVTGESAPDTGGPVASEAGFEAAFAPGRQKDR